MTKHYNDIAMLEDRAITDGVFTVTGAAPVLAPTLATQGVDCRHLSSVLVKLTAHQNTGINCKITITPWLYGQTRDGATADDADGWTPLSRILMDCRTSDPLKQIAEIKCDAGDRIYLQMTASTAGLSWATAELFTGVTHREAQPVSVQGLAQAITAALEQDKAPDFQVVADVTNGTDDTYHYYIDRARGHLSTGFLFELNGGSGTVTCTIEATMQNDGTAPAACTYTDITNDIAGAATITASGMYFNENLLGTARYIHVQVVAATGGANDADWNIQYGSA